MNVQVVAVGWDLNQHIFRRNLDFEDLIMFNNTQVWDLTGNVLVADIARFERLNPGVPLPTISLGYSYVQADAQVSVFATNWYQTVTGDYFLWVDVFDFFLSTVPPALRQLAVYAGENPPS